MCLWLKFERAFSTRSSPALMFSFPARNVFVSAVYFCKCRVVFLRSFIPALFLYVLGPSLLEMKFYGNFFPGYYFNCCITHFAIGYPYNLLKHRMKLCLFLCTDGYPECFFLRHSLLANASSTIFGSNNLHEKHPLYLLPKCTSLL